MKRLLSVNEAAEYLGSTSGTLYNWVSSRRIRCIKQGRSVRFDIRDLDHWIDSHALEPLPALGDGVKYGGMSARL